MKKDRTEGKSIEELLQGKRIPILVLDQRWHKLFPAGLKPPEIVELEHQLNDLLKKQGKLVNSLKSLKNGKKKLMDAIVANMSVQGSDKKKNKQQKLLIDTNTRIEQESDELMNLPYEIKKVNQELLVEGVKYCSEDFNRRSNELSELNEEIVQMRNILKEKVAYKVDLEESIDTTYSLMHAILGREVMNLFDRDKFNKS